MSNIKRQIFIILCAYIFLIPTQTFYASVNPQTGENIWHLIAAINTEVDQISQLVANDSAGTFTVLDVIQDKVCTINSNIDSIQATVIADFAGTFTVLSDIENKANIIESTIDSIYTTVVDGFASVTALINELEGGCPCQPTPITVPSTGIIIDTSGIYCLSGNVALQTGADIQITGSDVVFDLNDYTINGGNGISVSSVRVTIQNGFITNSMSNGISTLSTPEDIFIHDLEITNAANAAINIDSTTDLVIQSVKMVQNLQGILLSDSENCQIENCQANSGTVGFSIVSSCTCVTLESCAAVSNTGNGFTLTNNYSVNLNGCEAYANSSDGFFVDGTDANQTIYFSNCISKANAADGFDITQGDPTGNYVLKNCTAMALNSESPYGMYLSRPNGTLINCQTIGYPIGFELASGANDCLLKTCSALINHTSGFQVSGCSNCTISQCKAFVCLSGAGFDLSNSSNSSCIANLSTAAVAPTGFAGTGDNNSIFYLDNALFATTSFAGVGSQSAPVNSLTSTGRLYGDNLQETS